MTDLCKEQSNGSPYEGAIMRLRSDPGQQEFIRQCYLDDPLEAAQRFAASEEFADVCRILSIGSSGKGLRVLDVGCGNGIASFAFASLGCDVVALEPDPSPVVGAGAVDLLKQNLKKGTITPVSMTVGDYVDGLGGFDIVYMRQVAHHFPVLEEGLARCVELLKPMGTFLMTREHVADTPQDLEIFRQKHALTRDGVVECAYPAGRYRSALLAAGLAEIREWGPFDSVINYYPAPAHKIRGRALEMMQATYGRVGALLFRHSAIVERWVMHRLSERNRMPGRLYSFRGIKPKRR